MLKHQFFYFFLFSKYQETAWRYNIFRSCRAHWINYWYAYKNGKRKINSPQLPWIIYNAYFDVREFLSSGVLISLIILQGISIVFAYFNLPMVRTQAKPTSLIPITFRCHCLCGDYNIYLNVVFLKGLESITLKG
jgi:hypothetical protein